MDARRTGDTSGDGAEAKSETEAGLSECFVVMPITDPDTYTPGHFRRVFEDLFEPACLRAGFKAIRADDSRQTNLIHLDVLQRLLESPLMLCDLSSRNPNVLFELGLRQAFDKPVVLVQEIGTPPMFDIAPLRYTDYRPGLVYREVLEDQARIASAITATVTAARNNEGINSLVKILAITRPAALPDMAEANSNPALQVIRAELSELRHDIRAMQVDLVRSAKLQNWTGGDEQLQVAHNTRQMVNLVNKIRVVTNEAWRRLPIIDATIDFSEGTVFVIVSPTKDGREPSGDYLKKSYRVDRARIVEVRYPEEIANAILADVREHLQRLNYIPTPGDAESE